MNLALNNLQRLICHKPKQKQYLTYNIIFYLVTELNLRMIVNIWWA